MMSIQSIGKAYTKYRMLLLLAGSVVLVSGCSTPVMKSKLSDSKYCDPNYHSCAAPFSIGKSKIAPSTGEKNTYCDPNYHHCSAPFSIGNANIAPSTGEEKSYCDPNLHRCSAPFSIGKSPIDN